MAIRHCVPIRDDVSAVIITHFDGGHNDDTVAVLWRIKVLVNFKQLWTEGGGVVVLAELWVVRVEVVVAHLAVAVVVREDEDDSQVAVRIHRPEVEVGEVVDHDLEGVDAWYDGVLPLRHDGLSTEVREDGLDQGGGEDGLHLAR